MKRENPKINFDLKLLRLQNWRKPKPAEAAQPEIKNRKSEVNTKSDAIEVAVIHSRD